MNLFQITALQHVLVACIRAWAGVVRSVSRIPCSSQFGYKTIFLASNSNVQYVHHTICVHVRSDNFAQFDSKYPYFRFFFKNIIHILYSSLQTIIHMYSAQGIFQQIFPQILKNVIQLFCFHMNVSYFTSIHN